MKRFFIFMALSVAALAMSCTPEDNEPQVDNSNAVLTLTSEGVARFPQEGGDGVIYYTLENVSGNVQIEAICADEWVTINEVGNTVTYSVAPNDTQELRMSIILLSYAKQSVQVVIEQQGMPDVEFHAGKLNGRYDKKDTTHPDAYKYTVILSKYGTTHETDYYSDDTFYKFYIYSSVPAASDPYLPWGEYRFDTESGYQPGTFAADRSEVVQVDKEGKETVLKINDGVVVVSDNRVEALLTLENGEVHKVVYAGSLNLYYLISVEKGPYSTLEEDYDFNIVDAAMMLLYDGDNYGVGRGSWEVRFMEDPSYASGAFFRIPVIVESLAYDADDLSVLYGTYTADTTSSRAANTFLQGYKYNGDLYGAWYLPLANGGFGYYASAIAEGEMTIAPDGEEVVVTLNVVDDRGKKITGTCRCKYIESYDRTSM